MRCTTRSRYQVGKKTCSIVEPGRRLWSQEGEAMAGKQGRKKIELSLAEVERLVR